MDNNFTYFTAGALPESSLRQLEVSVYVMAQRQNLMYPRSAIGLFFQRDPSLLSCPSLHRICY
jgi:hypothetical protein